MVSALFEIYKVNMCEACVVDLLRSMSSCRHGDAVAVSDSSIIITGDMGGPPVDPAAAVLDAGCGSVRAGLICRVFPLGRRSEVNRSGLAAVSTPPLSLGAGVFGSRDAHIIPPLSETSSAQTLTGRKQTGVT